MVTGNAIKTVAKIMLLVMGVLIVLFLFTLPLTFYYIYEYTNILTTVNTSFIPDDDCDTSLKWLEQQYSMNYTADEDSAECTSNEYGKGGVCEEVLLEWIHCTLTNYSYIPIFVPYETTLNDNIKEIFELLNSFPDCQSQAIPFLCQYYYPLVDCVNDVIYTTSKEECISIISTVCSVPWSLAELAGINGLPNCELLQGSSINTTNTSTNNSVIACQDDFFKADGICVPHCEQIHIGPQFFATFEAVYEIIYLIIAAVFMLILIIYSIQEWKKIFRFPTLFQVFMIANLEVAAIVDAVAYFVGPKLFCKESNLLKSILTDPTIYCIIDGAILHYTLFSATIWWFIHLSILVFRVAFPFKAKQLNDYKRCTLVYCLLTVGGFLSPIPGIIVALTTDENRFRIAQVPPRRCNPPATWRFYLFILPISVIFAIGVLFLGYIIKAINKIRSNVSRRPHILGPGERKLLVFLVLFLVFGEYSMIYLTIIIINKDELLNATATYFQCEATGHIPGKCSTDVLDKWYTIIFIMERIFHLLFKVAVIAVFNSIFDWRKYCKKCFQ